MAIRFIIQKGLVAEVCQIFSKQHS